MTQNVVTNSTKRFVTLLALLVLVASACGGDPAAEPSATADPTATVPAAQPTTEPVAPVPESTVPAIPSEATPVPATPAPATGGEPSAAGQIPGAAWGIEEGTFDLVEVSTDTGEVLRRISGWGAELAQSDREGGAQTLTTVKAVGDALWVADCCEPAVGNLFRVDPASDTPVPEATIRVNGDAPAGSPDGSKLAFQQLDSGVAVIDAMTGEFLVDAAAVRDTLTVPPGASDQYFTKPLTWLDESTLAVAISVDGQSVVTFVSIANLAAPAAVGAVLQIPGTVVDGATRGDGSLVLAVVDPARTEIVGRVFDPETGEEQAVFDLPMGTSALDYDPSGTYLLVSRAAANPTWLGAGTSGIIDAAITGSSWSNQALSTPAAPTSNAPIVDAFTSTDVSDAGLEGIGCWFYRGGDETDTVFHGGFEATFAVVDGRQVSGSADGFWSVEDVVTTDEYELAFIDVGDPVADSIESTRQDATLVVTPADPNRTATTIAGELWCGV